jgi:hypothetical protein
MLPSLLFLASVVADALTSLDTVDADVPASLRGASFVFLCILASPVFSEHAAAFQRLLAASLLAAVSLSGLHSGNLEVRVFDCIYTTLCGFTAVGLFSSGGVDEQAKLVKEKKDTALLPRLRAALLLYASLRTLRCGFFHAAAVQDFRVAASGLYNATHFDARGYAHASLDASVWTVFGASSGVAAALLLTAGSQRKLPIATAAALQLISALALFLVVRMQEDSLPAIFGPRACKAATEVCAAASVARRFARSNVPVPQLFLSGLGLLAMGGTAALAEVLALSASLVVWMYGSDVTASALCIALILATWIAFVYSKRVAALLYLGVILADQLALDKQLLASPLAIATASLFLLRAVVSALRRVLSVRILEQAEVAISFSGVSGSFVFYLHFVCLLAAANGDFHKAAHAEYAIADNVVSFFLWLAPERTVFKRLALASSVVAPAAAFVGAAIVGVAAPASPSAIAVGLPPIVLAPWISALAEI